LLTRSNIEGIVWPGLPGGEAATLASLMFELEQTQYFAPDKLFAHQRHQLRALFVHAMETAPFYAERFAKAGFDPHGDITPETISRIPILARTDYQSAALHESPGRTPASHGKHGQVKSSGTTGRPVTVIKTSLSVMFLFATELRGHLWHRRDVGGKLAVIRHLEKPRAMAPDGIELQNWGPAAELLYPDAGPMVILNIASRLKDQADWLIRHDPHYLLSYPSNLLALGEYFEAEGLALPSLRQICTTSELVGDRLRETMRRVWNVPVKDLYSCEEAGCLAHQCPDFDHYHVQSENVYLEVVDESGAPCAAGQTGRVLITTLHNFATPLIRYEVGDYAELGPPCPCGRGLPVITRILGRRRNRLALPNGSSEFPYLGEYADYTRITTAIRQFQFIQHNVEEIEMKLVVVEPLTPEQEEKIKQLIVASLGHPFRVSISYHDEIAKGAGGKFEEFISRV
jgi:phenylacetate-coenzyme A ligase PaaK-like adenylate-forming protein